MSLRFLLHLFALCVAAVVFLLLPEQRFAASGVGGSDAGEGATSAAAGDDSTGGFEPTAEEEATWAGADSHASRDEARTWPGLRGRVLDLAGERVPGLTFHLGQQRSADPRRLEGAAKSLHAVSDFDGTFEILVADAPGELTLAGTDWVLLGEWRRQPDDWHMESDLLVTQAVTVAGRVTRADGSGSAAEVRASAAYALPQGIEAESRDGFFTLACSADEQGQFTLGRVPALPTTRLHVRTPEGHEQTLPLPEFAPGDMRIVID